MKRNTEHRNEEKVRAVYGRAATIKKVLINMQEQVRGQPLSLALGDYVIYKGERINAMPYSWKMSEFKDKLCIISAISPDASKYCIEGWNIFVDRASLTFVRDADPESLTRIIMMLDGEDEPQEDESGEDESEQEIADDSPPASKRVDTTDPRDHRSTQKAILAHHEASRKK